MAKPGISASSFKIRMPSWKWLVGGGVATAAVLALTQCGDGNNQQNGTSSEAVTPVDPNKTYYQIINQATLSDQDSPDKAGYNDTDPAMAIGSCVEGVFSGGRQIEGDRTYRVRATDAEGNTKEGYVFMGHIGDKALDPRVQGFTCQAQFVTATASVSAQQTSTYITGEEINLRDGGSRDLPVWGTLAKGSCVTDGGSREDGMMQVGLVAPGGREESMQYKWAIAGQLQASAIPADKCFASVTKKPEPALDF